MQNAVNKNEKENVVGITSAHVSDAIKRVHDSNAMFAKEVIDNASRLTDSVCIIKKDGTKEQYNVQKVFEAVKKSATRMLIKFSDEDLKRICDFVNKNVRDLRKEEISIWEIHNIVESALESINPVVARSYRNYRNYKTDFVAMLD